MPDEPTAAPATRQVSIAIPADGAYVSLVRSATAGYAARMDLTLDVVEDLRLAVDEACALLLRQSRLGSVLRCDFDSTDTHLTIDVSVESDAPERPVESGFAWAVLNALADDVRSSVGERSVTLTLRQPYDRSPGA